MAGSIRLIKRCFAFLSAQGAKNTPSAQTHSSASSSHVVFFATKTIVFWAGSSLAMMARRSLGGVAKGHGGHARRQGTLDTVATQVEWSRLGTGPKAGTRPPATGTMQPTRVTKGLGSHARCSPGGMEQSSCRRCCR